MDSLPTEILHEICLKLGYKQTLQLCKTSSLLNAKISNDYSLWKKFVQVLTKDNPITKPGCSKEAFLSILCFDIYLDIDILEGGHHNCAR